MAVAVQQPQRRQEEKDPLDTIIKGLAIASSVFGIGSERQKNALMASKAARDEEMDKFNIAAKEADLSGQGFKKIKGEDGSLSFQRDEGYESLADRLTKSKIEMNLAEAKRKTTDDGTAGLAKRLDIMLKTGQLKEQQRKETEVEGPKAKAAGFARRAEKADQIINELAESGFDRTSWGSGLASMLPGSLQSSAIKQQQQAERNFVNAILRPESGASISPAEFESASLQYFPRAGDDPQTIANKAQNRAQAIASLHAEAGGRALGQNPLVQTAKVDKKTRNVIDGLGLNQAQAGQAQDLQSDAMKILQKRKQGK